MAKKIIIDLEAKTDKALKGIDNVAKSVSDLNKEVVNSNKKTETSLNGIQKASKTVAKGIKGIGTGLKALGLGLIISSFETLKDLFSQNQKIVDLFTTSFEFAGQMVSQVTTAFTDIYDALTQSSDQFDALGKVIKGLLTIAITPLKLGFYELKLAMQLLKLGYESMFGDDKSIQEAKKGIEETKTEILEVASAGLQAGKSIATNFVEAVTEVGDAGKIVAKELGEVNVKSALESAKAITQLKKSAELASVLNQGLIEKYDRQAEQLRQIRDDDSKSIEERIKANQQLALILDEQEVAMKKNAKIAVDAAAAELSKNKDSIELQKAYQEALNEQAGIEAQITGFRSEQQTNTNSLLKEQKEIMNEISLFGKSEREKERLELQQEYDLNKELIEREVTDDAEKKERLLALQTDYNGRLKEINDGFDAEDKETQEKKLADKIELVEKENQLEEQKRAMKQRTLDNVLSIVNAESAVGKAALIAKQLLMAKELILEIKKTITFSTQAAARSTVAMAEGSAQTAKIGFPQNIPMLIGYAAQAAGIFSAIRSAVRSSKSGANIPNIATPSTPSGASVPPAFNVVGASGTNQLADAIGGQSQKPVQAYVVGNDVTTSQSMDRAIIDDASLGG
jgi:hypothetical protein